MAEVLYAQCAEVLSLAQSMKDDLAALLDPDTGLAPRFRQLCRNRIEELENDASSEHISEEMELLRLEDNTWALLQAVMPSRKTEISCSEYAQDLLQQNPYTPTATIAQAILNASPVLTELIVVREWLQDTAPSPMQPEATTGYWKFTKHNIMQGLRTGSGVRQGLVKEIDPDAVNRADGRTLSADDSSYEKSLVQALYGYIRAGRLEDAIELCKRAHQPWRAASIRGSLLLYWKDIANERPQDEVDSDDVDAWTGNPNRRLWKAVCTRAALNTALADYERVLYAALAPSPQTSLILKSACRTWEDHLWAQISIMCEEKQTMEMSRLGGSFWEGGMSAVEKGARSVSRETMEEEEEEWEEEVRGTLDGLKSVHVEEGPPTDHPFHFSQLNIIQDRTGFLLEVFAEGLQNQSFQTTTYEYAPMCRFFAHLCLFLQMIDVAVPPDAVVIILEAYLQILEAAGKRELIAMYAGALGENAVSRYAVFLVSLELSADPSERQLALTRAKEHGLDVDGVAAVTAEMTMNKALELLPALRGPLPSMTVLQPQASDAETLFLRSIEWTTFCEATYDRALEQANHICRYFLATGRVQLAQQLLNMLPTELAAIGEPEEQATEYLHYSQFFSIWETLERIVECQALEVSDMNRDTRSDWLRDYKLLLDQSYEQIVKLLIEDWLVSDVENTGGDARRRALIRIRQIYIPELVIRLHFTLFASRHRFPGNLKLLLQLVNIVADSRYKLYEDFFSESGARLDDYLRAVRQAILGGLEGGGSDPFRIISQLRPT
ncbi:nuclear pore protein 84/107 [Lentinula aciculospora]|uniref:Nuclear pore complex protein n=1 Tax=Lentinula aciculospora TaxID=153920 RepID=A0A9W9DGE3_9AGAR|nr:nuclear pore protein 84/107 [Lentinula aciculospora]